MLIHTPTTPRHQRRTTSVAATTPLNVLTTSSPRRRTPSGASHHTGRRIDPRVDPTAAQMRRATTPQRPHREHDTTTSDWQHNDHTPIAPSGAARRELFTNGRRKGLLGGRANAGPGHCLLSIGVGATSWPLVRERPRANLQPPTFHAYRCQTSASPTERRLATRPLSDAGYPLQPSTGLGFRPCLPRAFYGLRTNGAAEWCCQRTTSCRAAERPVRTAPSM
jgi:hypothetical protein